MMIRFEYTRVSGFEAAIRGMRNPWDSWEKSDSTFTQYGCCIGPEDEMLCRMLIRSGPEHAKFMRQIICWTDIIAPRFWWTEFDTYRIGVEKDSCSTMHTVMKNPFTDDDFGGEALSGGIVADLNALRELYNTAREKGDGVKAKDVWRRLVVSLPQGYMQKRTVMMSYQAIRQMCIQRRNHKLEEWHDFISWAKKLPESWMLMENEEDDC